MSGFCPQPAVILTADLLHAISKEQYSIWSWFLVHLCKMMIPHLCKMIILPGIFFSFSKVWFFRLLGGCKCKKMVQNDKKLCPLRLMYQEPCIIWLSFLLRMCKKIISSGVFHCFKILIFWVVRGVKRPKKKKKKQFKMTKNFVHRALYLRNHSSYDWYLWYTCVKW